MPQDRDIPLHVVLRCDESLVPRVRYVFDTLFMAAGRAVTYEERPPQAGGWLLYASSADMADAGDDCLAIVHSPRAWSQFAAGGEVDAAAVIDGLAVVLPQDSADGALARIGFDVVANAFFFLASWSERAGESQARNRQLYAGSIYERLDIPQDIVDRYLAHVLRGLQSIGLSSGRNVAGSIWPDAREYAVVLSHDVDFVAESATDTLKQGVKTVLRHLVRQRDPVDALKSGVGFLSAIVHGRDPYSGVHDILARETSLSVRSSFQVAVGHRHPADVNYRIENDATCDYLRAIVEQDFDLCLHGSYLSSERPEWYCEEAELLGERLSTPRGARQHFLSFQYDNLFRAAEQAGIEYDMSMGYPDHIGPRAGFSFPYFPYCVEEERPYDVLQISLLLMDVTLRGYMGLKGDAAWRAIHAQLADLRTKGGCGSVVWHPIVFGGARDPGYGDLFWRLVQRVRETGGLATDGRTINSVWRHRAATYASFADRAQV